MGALRLIPAPLTALLLLMLAKPSLSLAGLALGLHHGGVMGRVLIDDIRSTGVRSAQTMKACGAPNRVSWLYGPLADVSRAYLTYATYRLDVILRDTAIIGDGWRSRFGLAADGSPQLVSLVVGALDRADLCSAHTAG